MKKFNLLAILILMQSAFGVQKDINIAKRPKVILMSPEHLKSRIDELHKKYCSNSKNTDELIKAILCSEELNAIEQLLKAGCNLERKDDVGATPLLLALKNGKDKIAVLLMQNGANIYIADKCGNTTIMEAVEQGCIESVKLLFKMNKDLNHQRNIEYLLKIANKACERRRLINSTLYDEGMKQVFEFLNGLLNEGGNNE